MKNFNWNILSVSEDLFTYYTSTFIIVDVCVSLAAISLSFDIRKGGTGQWVQEYPENVNF